MPVELVPISVKVIVEGGCWFRGRFIQFRHGIKRTGSRIDHAVIVGQDARLTHEEALAVGNLEIEDRLDLFFLDRLHDCETA